MNSIYKIDVLTRVEGHCTVKLVRDDRGRVVDAGLQVYESPRFFEALLVGRCYDEIADIVSRICSICSTVHKVAALQAVEQALDVTISRQTLLLRELAVHGGQIESHALHIFCLALPDYLGVSGFQEMVTRDPDKLKTGLRIKKLGNMVQEVVGGRAIHPFNLVLGGLGRVPAADALRTLSQQLSDVQCEVAAGLTYILNLNNILPLLPTHPFCAATGGSPLFGDHVSTSSAQTISVSKVAAWFNEQVESGSHAKISRFDNKITYMVGPLARVLLSMPAGYMSYFTDTSIRSSLKARIVELQQSVERAQIIIEQLLDEGLKSESPATVIPKTGAATSVIEAPRGVLLHSYCFDSRGVCTAADIITPTAINQGAMVGSLKELIRAMDGSEYDQIKAAAEILIRCYDPCISCAVH